MSDYLAPELEEPEHGLDEIQVVTAGEFAAVDEPGIDSLLGTSDENLIAVGSDVMLYGDGGAGKTTLTIDLACHLATGTQWLGIAVSEPRTVLLIENEGPRPLFRRKLRRKLAGWPWGDTSPADRILVWEAPWGGFSFGEAEGRAQLARLISEHEVDLVITGPLTQLGMDEAGTLQDVRRFHALIDLVRERSLRRVAFLLIHHESKAGRVSGAWEGVGDTLLQLQSTGHRAARVFVQKSRWSATHHGKTIRLVWSEGDSFSVEEQTPTEVRLEATFDQILDFVKAHGGCGWGDVMGALKVNEHFARERRNFMLNEGVLVDLGKGERDARGHRFELWYRDDPARPLAIGELAGESAEESAESGPTESAEIGPTPGTTHSAGREAGIRRESAVGRPSKAADSLRTTLAPDSSGSDGGDPYDW